MPQKHDLALKLMICILFRECLFLHGHLWGRGVFELERYGEMIENWVLVIIAGLLQPAFWGVSLVEFRGFIVERHLKLIELLVVGQSNYWFQIYGVMHKCSLPRVKRVGNETSNAAIHFH